MMFVDVVKAICVSVIVKVLISNFHPDIKSWIS